ncbi:DJ-1/PfpI family protein [Bradyrhizobium sp. SYSU BS000235]|uniref:AraC family transcriptional regulator n=1 Tax=Bradyrhizobium sp. SYSU BS000235 TaxID=3411332 RepID=UPI003C730A78
MRNALYICLGAIVVLAICLPALLSSRGQPTASPAPEQIASDEHQKVIAALKPPKRQRPAIALIAANDGTEVADFLTAYGILKESGVADVTAVAERQGAIRLYPNNLKAEAQATTAEFDASYPEGADYVVVPALEQPDNAAVIAWLKQQHEKGATIVSICNGSLTMAAAGLLDGRKATGHWYSVKQIQKEHPSMERVRDRRYVVDRGIATSTGITASLPLMTTLVEAIGGRDVASRLATRIGLDNWDARHTTSAFQLTLEHRKTFIRNKLSVWRDENVGIKLNDGVDEIALGLMADAYARTELTELIAANGGAGGQVQSRRGLTLQFDAPTKSVAFAVEPPRDQPARVIDRELSRIATRYDAPTAAFVALTMEYPWSGPQARLVRD